MRKREVEKEGKRVERGEREREREEKRLSRSRERLVKQAGQGQGKKRKSLVAREEEEEEGNGKDVVVEESEVLDLAKTIEGAKGTEEKPRKGKKSRVV